jgi:type IV secretory pathway VirB2 component (pilin)
MSHVIGKLGLPAAKVSLLLVITATASPAYDAGSNMPWEQPLQQNSVDTSVSSR